MTLRDLRPRRRHLRNVCRLVSRLLTILKRLWPNDVADAVSREQSGAGELFLSISSDVARDNGQAHTEAEALEVAHPQSDKSAPFVIAW